MVRMFIDGVEVASERARGAVAQAETLHDCILALTYGDDAETMARMGYRVMSACALMVDIGVSAQKYFVDAVEAPITVRSAS